MKASVRIQSAVKGITDYLECFVPENVPIELIGFCITHMDTVNWGKNELTECIKTGLGIKKVIFSCTEKKGFALI